MLMVIFPAAVPLTREPQALALSRNHPSCEWEFALFKSAFENNDPDTTASRM
jgi:hypothetical protein